jgi:Protein kinase domain/PEGA domain
MGAAEREPVQTVGRYEVVGRLAMGGMAEILLGRLLGPSGFERPAVIKRILPHLVEQPSFVDMFVDEARLAARIQHKNVVHVHELGQEQGNLFLVMEYLEGENAAGLVRRSLIAKRDVDFALAALILAEACSGLHAAHELTDASGQPLGLVHRDVSPQNIFVTYAGAVKVLDFGIAKAADSTSHTEVGQLKGKFEYMSPEQCRGKAIDRRSDVFALGIVLYELLTRRRLFKRDSKLAVLEAVCRDPIHPPSRVSPGCPPALDQIAMRALQREPADRYQSAAEMRRDLLAVVRELLGFGDPEEALSQLMGELFQDRIAAKREMLRRVSAGIAVGEVPSAEADERVEIPEIERERPSAMSSGFGRVESGFTFGSHAGSGVDALHAERAQARNRFAKRVVATLLAVSILGALVIWWSMPKPDGVALRTGTATFLHARALVATPAPSVVPMRKTIVLSIVSEPTGARVFIAGSDRGTTPLDLELDRGFQPLEVTVSLDGYLDAVERVTPDLNQRLRVSLSAKSPTHRRIKPSGGGFHRFD